MKITRNSPEHLILGENPVWVAVLSGAIVVIFTAIAIGVIMIGEWFGAFFFIGTFVGLICMYVFVRRVQLIFDRAAGTLTIQRKNLNKSSQVIHALSDVSAAQVEGTGDMLRITLVLTGQSAGHHPITQSYSNVGDHHGSAQAINHWLDAYRGSKPI